MNTWHCLTQAISTFMRRNFAVWFEALSSMCKTIFFIFIDSFLSVYLWKRCINIEVENTQFIENRKILYEGHEPITPLQRGLLAIGSAFMALKEPTRSGLSAYFKYLFSLSS